MSRERANEVKGFPRLGDPNRIPEPLRRWYLEARRDLPWRRTRDPYAVWLSEIMCQQTRVSVVIPYYERFLARFPDAASLAAAPEDEVLSLWAGLGYYSRGRNLRHAARRIVEEHDGRFPETLDSIRSLPGVGEYTAAAIGSIVFGIAEPVIDGNVERVLARHGAIVGDVKRGEARREVRESARHALDIEDPGTHNQGMMELGALVCTPRRPTCDECPIAASCRARALGVPEEHPSPRPRRAPETQHWAALLAVESGGVWTVERGAEAELLPGHRGLPLVRLPGDEEAPPSRGQILAAIRRAISELTGRESSSDGDRGETPPPVELGRVLPPVRHSITYRRLHIHPVRLSIELPRRSEGARLLPGEERGSLPALFRKVIEASLPQGGDGEGESPGLTR